MVSRLCDDSAHADIVPLFNITLLNDGPQPVSATSWLVLYVLRQVTMMASKSANIKEPREATTAGTEASSVVQTNTPSPVRLTPSYSSGQIQWS